MLSSKTICLFVVSLIQGRNFRDFWRIFLEMTERENFVSGIFVNIEYHITLYRDIDSPRSS